MSKPKLSRTSSAVDVPDTAQQQLWHDFVKSIRKLQSAQSESDDNADLYAEKASLDSAIDQLSSLIKLKRREHSAIPPAVVVSIGTPTGSAGTPGSTGSNLKRKRRQSVSASPAPPSASDIAPASAAGVRGGTPMNRELNKSKKGVSADQPLLAPGRSVAFHVGRVAPEQAPPDASWIQAVIVRATKDEPRRYIVRDADAEEKVFTVSPEDLIPLPDVNAPLSSPANPKNLEDYPEGSQVLAVYPGSTSFYRATVIVPPLPGTGNGLGVRQAPKAKVNTQGLSGIRDVYRLVFVDDNDNVTNVEKSFVCLAPR